MTPRKADQLIKSGEAVTVKSKMYGEVTTMIIIGRGKRDLFSAGWNGESYTSLEEGSRGGVFTRTDLEILS